MKRLLIVALVALVPTMAFAYDFGQQVIGVLYSSSVPKGTSDGSAMRFYHWSTSQSGGAFGRSVMELYHLANNAKACDNEAKTNPQVDAQCNTLMNAINPLLHSDIVVLRHEWPIYEETRGR